MAAHAVKIGPEFFAKTKSEYARWTFALIREFGQNSIDADSGQIEFDVDYEDGHTILSVTNDGRPMTRDELMNKLLALGGSGKNFANTVGGFGAAKSLLYFCHKSFDITTGNLRINGSGANYDLYELANTFAGTRSVIHIKDNYKGDLENQVRLFTSLLQWRGTIKLNGKVVEERLRKGRGRKEFTWSKVYTNSDFGNLMVVRMDGIPMFTRAIAYRGCVVAELTGTSQDVLMTSRDGLKFEFQNELDAFVTEIAVNKRSAFKDNTVPVTTQHFPGYKLKGTAKKESEPQTAKERVAAALETLLDGHKPTLLPRNEMVVEEKATRCSPDFYIKNETGLKTPAYFLPEKFSGYAKTLLGRWANLLVELCDLFEIEEHFSVGFILQNNDEDEHVAEHDNGILYINPAILAKSEKTRVFKRRWKFNAEGNWELLAIAVHELVHFMGYSSHDELYAAKLTDAFAKVVANRARFGKLFSKGN